MELAIDVSKRYLWAVRQWDFYRLEHALDGALSEYQQAMERLRALEGAALERAAQDRGEEHGRAE